ncbi:MAG TPA: hypothetical protein VFR58_03750 [Flavisolibacter sp.]|nr:hypothetical protein [Flavisolibacter sp.]
MILRFLFYAFLIYLAYKLVFDFIIPVYRTTRKVKRGFREMQERMQQHSQQQYGSQRQQAPQPGPSPKSAGGDYIDFEEVK